MSARACPHPWKAVYSSKRLAKRAVSRLLYIRRGSMHPYRCECGLWHLGHKPGSRKNREPGRAAAA